jgi:ATP-binding cassette subfamily F protein 3
MISIENLSLQFGGQRIFNDVTLMIGPKDRVGLVGKNGAGKSTMLKLITGEARADEGNIVLSGDISLGYLPQQLICSDQHTVLEEAMSAFSEVIKLEKEIEHLNHQLAERTDYETDGYMELVEILSEKNDRLLMMNAGNTEALAEQTLRGLGFERIDFSRPTREFSGGWRMRIELAKILLRSPDVFLLDEPTNHLDIESIQWLENFLASYRGAVVLISHDRTFLDRVTNRTVEISLGKLNDYRVSYSKYVALRKERREQQLASYRNQQKQIEDTKDFIERFRYKATKSVQVQSRIKQLEKIDIIEVDEEDVSSIYIKFPPAARSGNIVFEARQLTKAFGSHVVLQEVDLTIERGEKVAFVGKNGEGKTTLSKIIINQLEAEGNYKLGHNVKIGYFAQNQDELLNGDFTVLETIDQVAVGDVRTKIRDILGAFLFRGDDVDKKVRVLSGGEKSRLSMVKLLLEPCNFLVLDEPTNHLDMNSKDLLKQALIAFDGTLLVVSHDREFLDGLTTKIFEFRNKKAKEFRGGIFEFLEKKNLTNLNELNRKNILSSESSEKQSAQSRLNYSEKKEYDKKVRKVEREISSIEAEIAALEEIQKAIELKISQGENTSQDLFAEYDANKKKAEHLLSEWEKLQTELDKLMNERS